MKIRKVEFLGSFSQIDQLPTPGLPEYAFTGRSNVGKSSLINLLTGRRNLAYTSAKPGKTQHLNFFLVNDAWYLVDLPGYGYAKAPKKQRMQWQEVMFQYISIRPNLLSLFVLLDARHEPQASDLDFMRQLGTNGIPFSMVFTKSDKISAPQLDKNMAHYKRSMREEWAFLPQSFKTSAVKKKGQEVILSFIEETNPVFYQQDNP